MKQEINHNEYAQLVGLKTLAEHLEQERDRISASIAAIVEERRSKYGCFDNVDELMFGGRGIDNWLHWLEIKVKD